MCDVLKTSTLLQEFLDKECITTGSSKENDAGRGQEGIPWYSSFKFFPCECTRIRLVRAHLCTDLLSFLVVNYYLINLSFKFRKDPSFRWVDILLFVRVFDLELTILSFLKPQKNAILTVKLRFFFYTICIILLHRSGTRAVGEQ